MTQLGTSLCFELMTVCVSPHAIFVDLSGPLLGFLYHGQYAGYHTYACCFQWTCGQLAYHRVPYSWIWVPLCWVPCTTVSTRDTTCCTRMTMRTSASHGRDSTIQRVGSVSTYITGKFLITLSLFYCHSLQKWLNFLNFKFIPLILADKSVSTLLTTNLTHA